MGGAGREMAQGSWCQVCLLLPGVPALEVQLGSCQAVPAGKQDLEQSVMMLCPLFPLFMDRKMGEVMLLYVYSPELGEVFLVFSVSYF